MTWHDPHARFCIPAAEHCGQLPNLFATVAFSSSSSGTIACPVLGIWMGNSDGLNMVISFLVMSGNLVRQGSLSTPLRPPLTQISLRVHGASRNGGQCHCLLLPLPPASMQSCAVRAIIKLHTGAPSELCRVIQIRWIFLLPLAASSCHPKVGVPRGTHGFILSQFVGSPRHLYGRGIPVSFVLRHSVPFRQRLPRGSIADYQYQHIYCPLLYALVQGPLHCSKLFH